MKRGILIALEGCDRSGKSTQVQLLLNWFKSHNLPCQSFKFPDRTTPTGQLIDRYLNDDSSLINLTDEAIHLLFSTNRWEQSFKLKHILTENLSHVILDRYAFSGVAYSSAKGLDLDWCKSPDKGLPKPDAVFYLNLQPQKAVLRCGYGSEKYEKLEFQSAVCKQFGLIQDDSWKTFDGSQDVETLHAQLVAETMRIIDSNSDTPLKKLWI